LKTTWGIFFRIRQISASSLQNSPVKKNAVLNTGICNYHSAPIIKSKILAENECNDIEGKNDQHFLLFILMKLIKYVDIIVKIT